MSSRPVPRTPAVGRFPEFPPRDDMQNPIHLHDDGHQAALRRHFGNPDATIVLGEVPIGWTPDQRRGLRSPDLLIAFGIDRPAIIDQRGYSIRDQGKPPDFVLEIASPTTSRNDYTAKRQDYAAFGVTEYWRFDPTGGDLYPEPLAGDRLADGIYRPIDIVREDESHYWGRSEALSLSLCSEEGRLRWWDPLTRRYLRTFDEADDERIAADERIRELEAEIRRSGGG